MTLNTRRETGPNLRKLIFSLYVLFSFGIATVVLTQRYALTDKQAAQTVVFGANPIADLFKKVDPTVVRLDSAVLEAVQEELVELPNQPTPNQPTPNQPPKEELARHAGTGVIIRQDSDSAYILTNNHVIDKAIKTLVTLANGKRFEAVIVGCDEKADLALLKINAQGLPVASFGSSRDVQEGQWAIAIGHPFNLVHTTTFGIVSGVNRIQTDGELMFQTDAALNPGNSGGPLFDNRGQVIGINAQILDGGQSIGYFIPSDVAQAVAKELFEHHMVAYGWLGATVAVANKKPSTPDEILSDRQTVSVSHVEGPAEKFGLEVGDVIQTINGKDLLWQKDFIQFLRQRKPGDSIVIGILRDGTPKEVSVTLGEWPKN